MTKNNNKNSNVRITSKDLEIAFLIGQVEGINDLVADAGKVPGKKVFTQALSALDSKGLETAQLAEFISTLFPASGKGRGKQQPVDGETRFYSVQKVKNSAPFIRLPLSILDVERGQEVAVTFNGKKIVVTA
tara:strand:+ start:154 stop:549 length:396 start_codon:yes stop_codon:yes gene_type:complete